MRAHAGWVVPFGLAGCRLPRNELRPQLERLEARSLLAAIQDGGGDSSWLSHDSACSCPFCSGIGLDALPAVESSGEAPSAANPLSSLPALHSNAGAAAKLFLDFNGHFEASWGSSANVTTPVYDQDGDQSTFSNGELASIQEIWARVAEDYAPFNIDVTTVDPGNQANKVVAVIAIGGDWSDWYGSSAGGVAYIGGFYNGASNVGYVFNDALGNGYAKYVAEAATHEAGHLFGLQHQSLWSGSTLADPYNPGNANWAPHMGNGYSSVRTTWYNGPTSAGPSAFQDDLAIISNSSNGFGYKGDDFGSTLGTASVLPEINGSINFSGLIEHYSDVDVWSFTTSGGAVSFQLAGAAVGTNLDAVLELRNSTGSVLISNSPSGSLGASLATSLGAGTYYLAARSLGDYGDMGQYTITGSVPVAPPAEISIDLAGVDLSDGQSVDFGSTGVGQGVTRTFTVTNLGGSPLTLTPLSAAALPAGFSLVSNLGATSLAAGASTQFSLRLTAAGSGTFAGAIHLANSDADENPFDFNLTGSVVGPEIGLTLAGANVNDGQTIDFGNVAVGSVVARSITVENTGNDTLTLAPLVQADLPAGFSLVSNLGSASLAAGESTTFVIQFDAAAAGTFSGSLILANNDFDEGSFDLALTAASFTPAPEFSASVAGQALAASEVVDFGPTIVGSSLERTITIRNDGTAALHLTALDPQTLPAGFSLYQNLGSTLLNPGETTSFILRLDAGTAGTFAGSIGVANDDADEGPFSFGVSGVVAPPTPAFKAIVDDGNVGFSQAGAWNVTTGKGYGSDIRTANKGSGGATANWTFSGLAAGQYQVWATWKINSTNATNAPFTIYDNTTSRGTTHVNQKLTPGGLSADGALWKSIGVATINSGRLVVKLTNAANNKVVADAIRIERVAAAQAPLAEIGVSAGGAELTSGQSVVTFGPRDLGSPQIYAFQVTNHGTGSLQLATLDPVNLPAGFSLVQNVGSTFLTPGETTSFSLQLDATAAGTFSGEVRLNNNDANEGPFTLQVTGTVVDPNAPVQQIVDDGAAGYTQTGVWTVISGKGYAGDIRTAAAGNGSMQSNWSFTGLPAGQYQVYATWKISSVYATNAPYSIYTGSQLATTTYVNQRLTPSGLWDGTTNWQSLGTVTVSGGQMLVRLTNAANGTVVADAIRIEKLSQNSPLPASNSAGEPADWSWFTPSLASNGKDSNGDAGPQPALYPPSSQPASADGAEWANQLSSGDRSADHLFDGVLELLSEARSAIGTEATEFEFAADEVSLAALG